MRNSTRSFFEWRRNPSDRLPGDTISPRDWEPSWLPRNPQNSPKVTAIGTFQVEDILPDYNNDRILDHERFEDEPEAADRGELEQGFERLAWYRRHHASGSDFGIYIRVDALPHLAQKINRFLVDSQSPTPSSIENNQLVSDLLRLALEVLIQHEWFHHAVEVVGYYIESITEQDEYSSYKSESYGAEYPGTACIEESLANATVARSQRCSSLLNNCVESRNMSASPKAVELVDYLAQTQPPAYQEFERFYENREYLRGCDQIAEEMIAAGRTASGPVQGYVGELMRHERPPNVDSATPDLPVYLVK